MESLGLCCISQGTNTQFPSFSSCSVPEVLLDIPDVRGLWQRLLISCYFSDNNKLVNSPVGVPAWMATCTFGMCY